MKWSKVIALLLVMTIVLSGCSKTVEKEASTNPTDAATSGAPTEAAEAAEPVNLTWFSDVSFWDPPVTWSTDETTVQGVITKATGLTFTMDIPPQDGDTKLSLALINGTLPDIMSVTDVPMIKQLIDSGKVWKMEEFLQKYDPESHILKDFPADVRAALVARDGDWYVWPSHMISADNAINFPPSDQFFIDQNATGSNSNLVFNGDIMERAGIDVDKIQTEDDLLAALETVKSMNLEVNGAPVIPMLIDGTTYNKYEREASTLTYLINSFGGMEIGPDGNYRDLILVPEAKHALKFLNTAIQKGYVDPIQLTNDNSTIKEYIANERVFCFCGNLANTAFHITKTINYVSVGALLSNEGKKPVIRIAQQATTGWQSLFVSKDCKSPELLAKFISYMSSKEGMINHVYGFEGIDFNYDANGLLVQTELGIQHNVDRNVTGIGAYWPFIDVSFLQSVIPAPTTPLDLMINKVSTQYGKESTVYDWSLLNYPVIDVASDLGIADAQITQYKDEQIAKILMATDDQSFESLYKEFIDTMVKYGINDVDALKNEGVQANYAKYGSTLTSINGD